jgi:bifunctional N-acetylglucosamine-1-phosphate-uridyltransferase/glucosamine-1-phosphate-acetyltransferase GlmU-like protein
MGATHLNKVCQPVAGRPAILRALAAYKAGGFGRFLLVAGTLAHQLMETVAAEHPEVSYVFQSQPRGTGHAALTAARALAAQNFAGAVAIVMGDKVVRTSVVRRMLRAFRQSRADALVTVLPKSAESSAGRIVPDAAGRIQGIVEVADIQRARHSGRAMRVGGLTCSAAEVEARSRTVNASMYLFRWPALRAALRHLRPNNAQREYYLTDTIGYLVRRHKVRTLLVADPTDLMTYNTPAELRAIERHLLRNGRDCNC